MPGPGFSMLSCWNLFISKYSKSPDVAWDWIKAYANAENGKYFMETYGIGSPFKSTYEDAELLKKHAHDYPAQLLNLGRTKSLPYTFEAYEVLFRHLGDLLTGSATAEEVVDRWQESWSKIEVPACLIEPAEKQGLKAM
jgi:ABC-type glycerol-3-phosphate transport system substrate-binding protein